MNYALKNNIIAIRENDPSFNAFQVENMGQMIKGKVVAIATGVTAVAVGNLVLCRKMEKFSISTVKIGNNQFALLNVSEVLAVISE